MEKTTQDAENMFHKIYNEGNLPMGTTTLINHATGIITECVVWAMGGIWFFTHIKPTDPNYQKDKERALLNTNTWHWIN